jgi:hypothetical protein
MQRGRYCVSRSRPPSFVDLEFTAPTHLRSKHMKDLTESRGFRGIIAGTRKTTPGILPCTLVVASQC